MAVVLLQPSVWVFGAAAVGLICISLWRPRLAPVVLLTSVALLLGAGRASLVRPVTLPVALAAGPLSVAGVVDDDPQAHHNGTRLRVRVDRILETPLGQQDHLRLQAVVYGGVPIHYGDLVLLAGRIEPPPRFDQFDYRAYLAEQGIAGVMPSARLVRDTPHPGDPFHGALFAVRHALLAAVDRALPEPQAALLLGVVFGYRAALPPALEQAMIASGLIHIVVISGLKVSLLARIVANSLGRFLPRAAPLIALHAMVVYALLAGASAAALRAAAMGGLVVIAGRLRRDTHVYLTLVLTGAIMLGLKPGLAADVSFLLSFAGTAGIASFTDPIARRLRFLPGLLRDPFAATIAAEVATWPLMLANFHQLSLVAPLANALVLPLLPVMMVVGGGGALLAVLLPLAGWPALQVAGAIAAWFKAVIQVFGTLPAAAITTPYFPGRWLTAALVINSGALLGIKLRVFFWQRKVWALLGVALLLTAALLLIRPDGRVHVYALDVGTGSAVLVRAGDGQQVLIDGGPDPDKFAQAIGRALPPTARELRAWIITGGRRLQLGAASAILGGFKVDQIIVADPDPWTPSLRSVIQQAGQLGVRVLVGPQQVDLEDVRLSPLAEGRAWAVQAGASLLAVIPPESGWRGFSPALGTAIFTSGGPSDWEQGPTRCLAVIQVAGHSRDGLPARALLNSLRRCRLSRTDQLGTIELISGNAGFRPAGP